MKSSWLFLAWAFVIAESLRFGGNQSWATTVEDDSETNDEQEGAAPNAQGNQLTELDNTDDEADSSDNTIAIKLTSQINLNLSSGEPSGDEDADTLTGFLNGDLPISTLNQINQTSHTESGNTSFSGIPELPEAPPLPEFVFFDGLDGFAAEIGLGSDIIAIVDAVDSSMQANVALALSFTTEAFAPIGMWSALDEFDTSHGLSGYDGFSIEWAIQASATMDGTAYQQTSTNGLELVAAEQYGADDGSETGNTMIALDGQDWDGVLWVSGNYYEFNTVVQLNVLWDGDTITALDESGQSNALPDQILSGQNTQINDAKIIDLADFEDANPVAAISSASVNDSESAEPETAPQETTSEPQGKQFISGAAITDNAVIQRNTIIDNDDVSLDIEGSIDSTGESGAIEGGADIYGSGQTQENDSILVTGAPENDPADSYNSFQSYIHSLYDGTDISYINGNYYEFNTIVQVNIVSDADDINWYNNGSDSSDTGDVIASGGNIQLNEAVLAHNDYMDSLFVGGSYTEYNLVLQVNALEDNDIIDQTNSLIDSILGTDLANDGSPVDHQNGQGDDGIDGSSADMVNVVMPNVLDELASQNPSLDAFI